MKPVVANPSETFMSMLERLRGIDDDRAVRNQIDRIIAKLRRFKPNEKISAIISEIGTLSAQDAKNFLLKHESFFQSLQENISSGRNFVISEHEDELISHEIGFGEGKRPQDYLDEFTEFIKTNRNEIAALNIVCTRPKDLTRADLKKLQVTLSDRTFTTKHLNAAISQLTNAEITADIISLIRSYALGAELLGHEEKIKRAVARLKSAHDFSEPELKWLARIEKYLLNESLINPTVFDEPGTAFKMQGGFKQINKVFGGTLSNILDELNRYLYDDGGNVA